MAAASGSLLTKVSKYSGSIRGTHPAPGTTYPRRGTPTLRSGGRPAAISIREDFVIKPRHQQRPALTSMGNGCFGSDPRERSASTTCANKRRPHPLADDRSEPVGDRSDPPLAVLHRRHLTVTRLERWRPDYSLTAARPPRSALRDPLQIGHAAYRHTRAQEFQIHTSVSVAKSSVYIRRTLIGMTSWRQLGMVTLGLS